MTLESQTSIVWVIGIQLKENYVFIPHFWDPNFSLIFKLLIYACDRTCGLILDSAWLV